MCFSCPYSCMRACIHTYEGRQKKLVGSISMSANSLWDLSIYCNWQHSWLQCSPAAEWKIPTMTEHGALSVYMWARECMCMTHTPVRAREEKRRAIQGGLGLRPNSKWGIGWRKSCLCEITAPTTASTHMADFMRKGPRCLHPIKKVELSSHSHLPASC